MNRKRSFYLSCFFLLACLLAQPARNASSKKTVCPPGMVLISSGWFLRGTEKGRLDEAPARKIYLKAFCFDKSEVSMGSYRACVRAKVCSKPAVGAIYSSRNPAAHITWFNAVRYCKWRKKRLPTEAEWEKAARGGRKTAKYPTRGRFSCSKAHFGTLKTYPCFGKQKGIVRRSRSYPAGPYGIYDLAGNVAEWVADCYSFDFYQQSSLKNPSYQQCTSSNARVLRGGSFASPPADIRITARKTAWPGGTFSDVGFRCATEPSGEIK